MEITITLAHCVAAIIVGAVMIAYTVKWRRENPWWWQKDYMMELSVRHLIKRNHARRQYKNFMLISTIVLSLIMMSLSMSHCAIIDGGLCIGSQVLVSAPFIIFIIVIMMNLRKQ